MMNIHVVVVFEEYECMCLGGTRQLRRVYLAKDEEQAKQIADENNGCGYTAELFKSVEDWTE